MQRTQRMILFSFLVTLATALHSLEMLLPNPFPLPGAKLGLANIASLLAIYLYGLKGGISVALLRVLISSLLTGTFLSLGFLLSLSGAFVSTLVMSFLRRYSRFFSLIGVSMAGALSHNLGQLLLASYLIQTRAVFYYLPLLLVLGLPAGFLTGIITQTLLRYFRHIPNFPYNNN